METAAALALRASAPQCGETRVGGILVSELANCYGTPQFVYDREAISRKWDLLRGSLPPEFTICYSMKANPSQAILKLLLEKGAGIEIASAGEFSQAVAAGCPPEKIIFAGPGKTEAELEFVLTHGVGEIHVESEREAARVSAISTGRGVAARIALRVNPAGDAEGGAMRMGGRPSPFGVDEERIPETLDSILRLSGLEFRGVHLFAGTQILSACILLTQYRAGIRIARRIAGIVGTPLATVDFGGGLGIPYFPQDTELDMDEFSAGVISLIEETRLDPLFRGTRFYVEPGRFLVGEAGIYITRVIDIKISREKKYLIVDGGMNHHLAASGNLGQAIKRNFPVVILNRIDSPGEEVVDIVGPLCTPLDILARGIMVPAAEVGDLVGILQSGAYARSASPLGFLSHPTPPEVWVEASGHRLIRRRGDAAAYWRDQCLD
jgi:diaminopimelate decarboxylase